MAYLFWQTTGGAGALESGFERTFPVPNPDLPAKPAELTFEKVAAMQLSAEA